MQANNVRDLKSLQFLCDMTGISDNRYKNRKIKGRSLNFLLSGSPIGTVGLHSAVPLAGDNKIVCFTYQFPISYITG